MENLFAYTEPGINYPAYISVNKVEYGVEVTVRSRALEYGFCGSTATIFLTDDQWKELKETKCHR